MRYFVATLIIISILLAGCNDKVPPTLECDKQYRYTILSPEGDELYGVNHTVHIRFEHTGAKLYRVVPDGLQYADALAENDKLLALVYDLNEKLSVVFANTPALTTVRYHWWYGNDIRISTSEYRSNIDYLCKPATNTVKFKLGVEYSTSAVGYRTYLRYVGDLVYVKIVSPGGSFVQDSFPQQLITQTLRQALSGEGEEMGVLQTALGSAPELSEERFADAILSASVGQAQEVASIQIATSDYEGRKELWPAISKALELATKQNPQANFVLLAKMSTNASAAAEISYSQSAFRLTGWQSVFSGKLEGSGGGGSGQGSYSYSMNQVVEATIVLVPPTLEP